MPSRMSKSGWEALPNVREWWETLSDVREWSEVYAKCLGMVGDLRGCLGVVGRPSRMTVIGRKTLTDVWEPLPVVR